MSTSTGLTGHDKPDSQSISGEEWEKLSPEAKIQLGRSDKWGWVVYRCSYAKEFDGPWNDLKRRIQKDLRASILRSDAPGIVETMDFVFVEDPTLEGASIDELQSRFQAWAREDTAASGIDLEDQQHWRSSRHSFFLRADGEGLRDGYVGYVGLVHGWPVPQDPEPELDDCTAPSELEREDWMKIYLSSITPYVYNMLENEEMFYVGFFPPKSGPVPYW